MHTQQRASRVTIFILLKDNKRNEKYRNKHYYLPVIPVQRHTTDKPWVTDKFRQLIRCRQRALKSGQTARYKWYRNRVSRMSGQLRQKFYSHKMEGLRSGDPHNWWRNVKQITGLDKKKS